LPSESNQFRKQMFVENIHIGSIISSKIVESGINRSELARRINKSRQNIDSIVKRKSLDVDLLISISKALSFNFLDIYSPSFCKISSNLCLEDAGFLSIQNKFLLEKVQILENQVRDKQRIIELLGKDIL